MRGKFILETGCGIGGGLDYISKRLRPYKALGCDVSRKCVSTFGLVKSVQFYRSRKVGNSTQETRT